MKQNESKYKICQFGSNYGLQPFSSSRLEKVWKEENSEEENLDGENLDGEKLEEENSKKKDSEKISKAVSA